MPEPVVPKKILYVDDEPALLELAKLFLERNGEFSVTILETAGEGVSLLETETFEAIISDYQMPLMDGIAFLKIVRSKNPDIPFILFTGRGREEIAIQAFELGADFYLQKGGDPRAQFAELVQKIRIAVNRRQAEEAVKEYEQRLFDIIDFLPDATFAIDTGGHVIAWNKAIEEMTGVSARDILGRGNYEYSLPFYGERRQILIDLVSIPDDDLLQGRYSNIKREGNIITAETSLPRPLGRYSVLSGKASILYNSKGIVVGAIESIRDVTEARRTEGALYTAQEKYSKAFLAVPEVIALSEIDSGTFLEVNDAASRVFGYSREELIGKSSLDLALWHNPEDRTHLITLLQEQGSVKDFKVQQLRKSGEMFSTEISAETITLGTKKVMLTVIRDITERVQAERAIRESEVRYRNVVEDQTELICRFDPSGVHVFVNHAYLRYFGKTEKELIGHRFIPEIPKEEQRQVREHFVSLTREHPFGSIEHRIIMPDGEVRWQSWSDRAIFDESGRIIEYQSVGRDITEKRRAEDEQRLHEQRLAALLRINEMSNTAVDKFAHHAMEEAVRLTNSTIGYIAFYNEDTRVLTMHAWSQSAMEECRVAIKPIDYPIDSTGLWGEAVRQRRPIITNDYTEDNPHKKGTPEGHVHLKRHMNVPIFDGDRIVIIAGVGNKPSDYNESDIQQLTLLMSGMWRIVQRKQAEAALSESEKRLNTILQFLPIGVFIIDAEDHRILDMNRKAEEIIGSPYDLICGKACHLFICPTAKGNCPITNGKLTLDSSERVLITSSGKKIPVLKTVIPITLAGRQVLLETVIDISERKHAEEALRESEQNYRAVIENLQDVFYRVDNDGNIIMASPSCLDVFGYSSVKEVLGLNLARHFYTDPSNRTEFLEAIKKTGFLRNFEAILKKKDGTPVIVSTSAHFHRDADGKILGIEGIAKDITQMKHAEIALRESEERFKTLFTRSAEPQLLLEANGIVDCNTAFLELFAIEDKQQIIGHVPEDFAPEFQPDGTLSRVRGDEILQEVMEKGVVQYEWAHLKHDINRTPVLTEVICTVIHIAGHPVIHASIRDITARKNAEDELARKIEELRGAYEQLTAANEELNSQYNELAKSQQALQERENAISSIFRAAPVGIGLVVNRVIREANETLSRMTGYSQEELAGKNARMLYPTQEDYEYVGTEKYRQIGERGTGTVETRWQKKDGSIITIILSSTPLDPTDSTKGVTFTALDITGRKKGEEELRESEDRYRKLVEISPDAIILHRDGKILYTNSAALVLIGASGPDKIVGKNIIDIVHPDFRDTVKENITRDLMGNETSRMELQLLREDGTTVIVEGRGVMTSIEGKPAVQVAMRDITERKKAELALHDSKEQFRYLVENSHDIIYRINSSGILTYVSPSWRTLIGSDPATVVGHSYSDFVHPDDAPAYKLFLMRVMGGGKPQSGIEYRIRREDGSWRWHTTSATPVPDENGRISEFVGISSDITRYRQTEDILRQTSTKLNLLNSVTRHDVNNQLLALLGFTQLAAQINTDTRIGDFLGKIETAGNNISRQIEFTRAYQNLGIKDPAWHHLESVLKKVRPKNIRFATACDGIEIYADPMLENVFTNLFDNAVRHGEHVTAISVRCEPVPDGLLITVEDNGVGVPLDEKVKIFEKGFGKHTGFGLFLTREILAITGISIHETGKHGSGARFEIHIPQGTFRRTS